MLCQPFKEIRRVFGVELHDSQVVPVPGRMNLIDERIDYH